uniref:Putative secreted peptide n=1 Tax=Anopheles braziliensis TaxID=58242 RepID=A0A2M3ZVJ3_9DIPT
MTIASFIRNGERWKRKMVCLLLLMECCSLAMLRKEKRTIISSNSTNGIFNREPKWNTRSSSTSSAQYSRILTTAFRPPYTHSTTSSSIRLPR